MTTIKQIAELAGVSRGTVDRVLKHRGGVSAETENKIQKIIKELHYEPNPAGLALAAQKNKFSIGVIIFSKKNPFFDDVVRGLQDKAKELSLYGCRLIIKRVAYNPEAQLQAIQSCIREKVHGVLITPYNDSSIIKKLNKISDSGIPVMTINSDITDSKRISYIGSHYYESGQAAAALMKLVTSGPVKLGLISGDHKILCHAERYDGFMSSLKSDSRFTLIAQGENFDDDQKSYELVSTMLQKHPDINAFYFIAAGVYGGCRAIAEHTDPGKIRVITFDNVPTTREMLKRGFITATICQEPYWQGSKALDLMFSYLNQTITDLQDAYYADLTIKIAEVL